MSDKINLGVLGAGTWGIALARMLVNAGHRVTVWSAIGEEIDILSSTRRHPNIPEIDLPSKIEYTKDIKIACEKKDIIVFAVPSPFVRATAKKAAPYITEGQIIVDVAKGIEEETLCMMTEIIAEEINNPEVSIVALSGPTHAEEVVRDLPTTIVSASKDIKSAEYVQSIFNTQCMRVYTNDDILGVELCGATKNIIALACGVAMGLGCGDNAKAAIITRGIAEISRLGAAMGCREQTFGGLAGIGDLIVTCTSRHSRNSRCGELVGSGMSYPEAQEKIGMVVEGYHALEAAIELSEKHGVEMPITRAVYEVICRGEPIYDVMRALMNRDIKSELIV